MWSRKRFRQKSAKRPAQTNRQHGATTPQGTAPMHIISNCCGEHRFTGMCDGSDGNNSHGAINTAGPKTVNCSQFGVAGINTLCMGMAKERSAWRRRHTQSSFEAHFVQAARRPPAKSDHALLLILLVQLLLHCLPATLRTMNQVLNRSGS